MPLPFVLRERAARGAATEMTRDRVREEPVSRAAAAGAAREVGRVLVGRGGGASEADRLMVLLFPERVRDGAHRRQSIMKSHLRDLGTPSARESLGKDRSARARELRLPVCRGANAHRR